MEVLVGGLDGAWLDVVHGLDVVRQICHSQAGIHERRAGDELVHAEGLVELVELDVLFPMMKSVEVGLYDCLA